MAKFTTIKKTTMKKLLSILALFIVTKVSAQFPPGSGDSLRNYNNRFIDNNSQKAFTNLRLHNLLAGIIDYADFIGSGGNLNIGMDTAFMFNDSLFTYRKSGVFHQFIIRGAGSQAASGPIYRVPFNDGLGHFTNDSNFTFDLSNGPDASRLIVGPYVDVLNGLGKINATSDNMNAATFNAYGSGMNTIIFKRARGTFLSPTPLLNQNDLFNLSGRGYTGSGFSTSRAAIYAQATQDWTDTTNGTALYFATTDNDSTTLKTRVKINSDGNVGINNTSPPYGLTVSRTMGGNKDSLPRVTTVGAQSVMLVDTVTGQFKRAPLLSINQNYFNTDLNLTGDRNHNGFGHSINMDSVGSYTLTARAKQQNKLSRTFITMLPAFGFPVWIGNVVRDTANTRDSINQSITMQTAPGFNYVQIGSQNVGLSSSYVTVAGATRSTNKGYINLTTDSLVATLPIKTTGLDSVLYVGNFDPIAGTNRLYKGLAPSGGGSTPTWEQVLTAGSTLTNSHAVVLDGKNFSMQNSTSGGGFLSTKFNDASVNYKIVAKDDPASNDSSYVIADGTSEVARVVNVAGNFTSNVTAGAGAASTNSLYANGTLISRSISINDTTKIHMVNERLISSVVQKGNFIDIYKDSIVVSPEISTDNLLLWIKQLPASASSSDSVLVQTASGQVKKRAQSDISGGGGGSTPNSYFQTADATVATTTTETTLISSGVGTLTIPANNLVAGKSYRLTVRGKYSTSSTNPANFNFRWYLGATQLLGSAAGVGGNKTDETFDIHSDFTCRTTGSSGSVMAQGMFFTQDGPGAHGYNPVLSTINTTISNTMDFTVEMNDSSAGNTVTIYILQIEEINP